eukprot:905651-Prymnesium_polylepis.2
MSLLWCITKPSLVASPSKLPATTTVCVRACAEHPTLLTMLLGNAEAGGTNLSSTNLPTKLISCVLSETVVRDHRPPARNE